MGAGGGGGGDTGTDAFVHAGMGGRGGRAVCATARLTTVAGHKGAPEPVCVGAVMLARRAVRRGVKPSTRIYQLWMIGRPAGGGA